MQDLTRIKEAAHRAMADQLMGRRFKRGVNLSAGHWQEIAIARA